MEKQRYELLDNIRGLALFNMIAYHGIWDLVYLYGQNISWYQKSPGYLWQQSICWTFIFLSGFCHSLGKHPFRRGLIIFSAGLFFTLATLLIMPENRIVFGILTFLGSAMILLIPFQNLLKKISPLWGLFSSMVLFFLTKNINLGFLGFEHWNFIKLPEGWYTNLLTTFLGFPEKNFYSTDYFSLFPWMFLYLCGYFFYNFSKKYDFLRYCHGKKYTLLSWMGKHSLEIYVLHQPVLYGIFFLWFQIL